MKPPFVVKSGKKRLILWKLHYIFSAKNFSEAAPKLLRRNAELLGQGALRFDNLTEAPGAEALKSRSG